MNTIDLKSLERHAFASYFQDGLMDMFVGVVMLLSPLSTLFPYIGLNNPQIGTALRICLLFAFCVLFMFAKRVITVPRLGRVEFGKHRKSRERQLWLIMAVTVSVTILLMVLTMDVLRSRLANIGSLLEHPRYIGVFFAVSVFVIFSFIAYFMNFTRAYFIGAVLAAGLAFDIAYDRSVLLGVGGLLILVIGLVHFVRFIHTYPVSFEPKMENTNGRA